MRRIGIIGFGFSGLMVAANLIRKAQAPLTIYVIAKNLSGLGVAYATTYPDHVLNVISGRMGAFEEERHGFHRWLKTADGARAKQQFGLLQDYDETDYVPRALFGQYLQAIWQDTQTLAAQKNLLLKLVPSDAVAITPGAELAILTERGDAIAVDQAVLATGHEIKPVFATVKSDHILQDPWATHAYAAAQHWAAPVMLMGTGLTMIDTLIMLRAHGYTGEVIAFSRHGLLPHSQTAATSIFRFEKDMLDGQKTLAKLLHFVRSTAKQHGDWRAVVDALRPHTQARWQQFSTAEKNYFFAHLAAYWSIHRHRMAPGIAARVAAEKAANSLRVMASRKVAVHVEHEQLHVAITDHQGVQHRFTPSRLVNCTGPELNGEKSRRPLLKQLLAAGLVEPHATQIGLATDPQHRVWGEAHPQLFAIGSLMTGQLLESTAVPELRVQAAQLAARLLA